MSTPKLRWISLVFATGLFVGLSLSSPSRADGKFSLGATSGYHRLNFNGSKKNLWTVGGRGSFGPLSHYFQIGLDVNDYLKKHVVAGSSHENLQFAPWVGVILMKGKSSFNPYLRAGFLYGQVGGVYYF